MIYFETKLYKISREYVNTQLNLNSKFHNILTKKHKQRGYQSTYKLKMCREVLTFPKTILKHSITQNTNTHIKRKRYMKSLF